MGIVLRAGAESQAGSVLVLWPQVRLSFPTCQMWALASAWAVESRA